MDPSDPDHDIHVLINDLAREEEQLWAGAGDGRGLDPSERARLDEIRIEVDRAYDLLQQRAALRAAGRDPTEAHERPPDIVERYQQ